MRSVTRPFTAVLAATALASCMDMSGPSGGRTSLAIAPRFSQSASLASATLAQAGVEYNAARIVIVRPPADTLKDTTIVFSPTSPQVTLELGINAVPSEALEANVQFMQNTQVLFSGKANVTAVAPTSAATATPVQVVVDYVGPGSTVDHGTITPGNGIYSANTTTQFDAKFFNDQEVEQPTAPEYWSVSNEDLATISTTGLLTPKNKRGIVDVTVATANGVQETITVQLAPASAGLRVVQGAGQSGPANTTLPTPVIVELFAADGLPAASAGQTVTFSTSGTGASITPASAVLDGNGRASASMKLGTTAGVTYIFKAKLGTDSVMWGGSATPGTPTHFVLNTSTTLTLTAGVVPDPVPTIRLADAQENSVPNQVVKVTIQQGATTVFGPANVPVDSIGLLEVYKVAPTTAGSYTIKIEADPGLGISPVTYNVTINPGPAAKLAFKVQPGTVAANQTMTPAVKVEVQDQFGNLVTSASGAVSIAMDPATAAGVNQIGVGSVSASGGVAVFADLKFSAAKNGVKIKVSGLSLPETLSAAFNITP